MAYSSHAIANGFLDVAQRNDETLTAMKLQKLAYFAHGWNLAIADEPLVDEPIQAWRFGPVIYSMYQEFREFGDSEITRRARDIRTDHDKQIAVVEPTFADESDDPQFAFALVDRMWSIYGHRSAGELSNLTHLPGTPWRQIWDSFNESIPNGITIPNDLIRTHFQQTLTAQQG